MHKFKQDWMSLYAAAGIVCSLFLIPGFSILRVFFDILHTMDLGVSQYAIPSAVWEMTAPKALWPGRTRQIRFGIAYASYRRWCKTNKVISVTKKKFAFKRFRPTAGKYPVMSQVTAKGAATRSMMYWMDEMCRLKSAVSTHDKVRALMFRSFVKADLVCRRAGRLFTEAEHELYSRHIERALRSYNFLAAESIKAGIKNWKIVPKFHALTHIAYDCRLNPRRVAANDDEDVVGKMKRVYCSCHANTASQRALQRYILNICLKWWELLHRLRGIPWEHDA